MAQQRALMNEYFEEKELQLQSLMTTQSHLVHHINKYNIQQEQGSSSRDAAGDYSWANANPVTYHGQDYQQAAQVQGEQQRLCSLGKRSREQDSSNMEPDEARLSGSPAAKAPRINADATGEAKTGRYSVARRTMPRYASGPAEKPFRFSRMPRTAMSVWNEWHHGANGNRAIRALEQEFGTGWRLGDLAERKYASNWVGTRKLIVDYVDNKAAVLGLSGPQVCNRLDFFVGGHVHRLIGGLRKGHDVLAQFEAGRDASEAR
ncbi:hypothetical protein CDD81_6953 [Ophiocordyceps australis]|uniref:Transcription activator GCR1-like domain-containing protein n=1 Tax=Ophiocordyceps australis TaxID=1399860 RepID=A0A2C5XLM0_9HYPO|nr:hypothetical protein CDD81_6953 [Ophiocordyceps australis]